MNNVEYNNRVYIFYKEERFFWKFAREYKVMVNNSVVTNCSTGYKTGQKMASFHFLEDQELK